MRPFDWKRPKEDDVLKQLKSRVGLFVAAGAALTVFLIKVPPPELVRLAKKAAKRARG
jgi:hypothetical protein